MTALDYGTNLRNAKVALLALIVTGALVADNYSRPVGLILALLGVIGYAVARFVMARSFKRRYANAKLKQYCICSKEALDKMKGVRGKMITQGGHAYLHAFFDASDRFPILARAYRESDHAYKITLVVPTEADLVRLEAKYRERCGVSLVKDAGYTVFKNPDGSPNPTITYLGVGPVYDIDLDSDIGDLRPLT